MEVNSDYGLNWPFKWMSRDEVPTAWLSIFDTVKLTSTRWFLFMVILESGFQAAVFFAAVSLPQFLINPRETNSSSIG